MVYCPLRGGSVKSNTFYIDLESNTFYIDLESNTFYIDLESNTFYIDLALQSYAHAVPEHRAV